MNSFYLIWLPHLVGIAFTFAFGAAVGSFVNVAAYRMPLGMSIISPPSRCGSCGRRLRWYENLPVIGWAVARGRCWSCSQPISLQYPLIEILTGSLFAAYYALVFVADTHGYWGRAGASWFQVQGFMATLPAFVVVVGLLASLVTATITDIKSFTIPLGITTTATVLGLLGWTIQGFLTPETVRAPWPIPLVGWKGAGLALGAFSGIAWSMIMLARGQLVRSFADYEQYLKPGETLAQYPHARREMKRELWFLLPIVVLGAIGFGAGSAISTTPPMAMQAFGGAGVGYLVGAGVMWLVRIIASLVKGVEAMGMGDVHLLGAVGACVGWIDPIAAFFIAPFSGLAWIAVTGVIGLVRGKSIRRELPYGPHLAIAVVAIILARPVLLDLGRLLFPGMIPAKTSLQHRSERVQ